MVKKLKNISIVWKSVLLYSLIYFIPLIVLICYLYNSSINIAVFNAKIQQKQLLYQIHEHFSSTVTLIANTVDDIANDKKLNNFLDDHYSGSGDDILYYRNEIYSHLVTRKLLVPQIHSLYIYSSNDTIPPSYNKRVGVVGMEFFPFHMESAYKMWWEIQSSDAIKTDSDEYNPSESFITCNRALRSPINGSIIGIVSIQLALKDLFYSLDETSGDAVEICVIDNTGMIWYSTAPQSHGSNVEEAYSIDSDQLLLMEGGADYNGKDFIVLTLPMLDIKCFLLAVLPLHTIKSEAMTATVWIIISVIGVYLGTIIAVILATFANNRRLRVLDKAMNHVNQGDYSVQVPIGADDELGRINRTFNDMVRQIDRLFHNVYQSELRQKDAKLMALEAQVNPHFLYNMLTSIACNAKNHDDPSTQRMAILLSRFYRTGLSEKANYIPLQEELNYLSMYIEIQLIRFGNNLHYNQTVQDGLAQKKVIKNILHPIVENAIVHGIENIVGNRAGEITLDVRCFDNSIMFVVSDNGNGMPGDVLNRINSGVFNLNRSSGYGLKNLYERLKLFYGDKAGLLAENIPGSGVRMTMWLPLSSGEDENDVLKEMREDV